MMSSRFVANWDWNDLEDESRPKSYCRAGLLAGRACDIGDAASVVRGFGTGCIQKTWLGLSGNRVGAFWSERIVAHPLGPHERHFRELVDAGGVGAAQAHFARLVDLLFDGVSTFAFAPRRSRRAGCGQMLLHLQPPRDGSSAPVIAEFERRGVALDDVAKLVHIGDMEAPEALLSEAWRRGIRWASSESRVRVLPERQLGRALDLLLAAGQPRRVFVCGTDAEALHYQGAAEFARLELGLRQGAFANALTYALPLYMFQDGSDTLYTVDDAALDRAVAAFVAHAAAHPDVVFEMTRVGVCGFGTWLGRDDAVMARCFANAGANVLRPRAWAMEQER